MPATGKTKPQSQPSPSDTLNNHTTPISDHASKTAEHVEQHDFINPTLNIIGNASRSPSYSEASSPSREGTPPPLPPRPQLDIPSFTSRPVSSHSVTRAPSHLVTRAPSRPQLVSKATTQLSVTNTQAFGSESRDDSTSSACSKPRNLLPNLSSNATSDGDESASVKSHAPTIAEGESLLGEVMDMTEKSKQEETLLRSLGHRFEDSESQSMFPPDPDFESAFDCEFDNVDDMAADGSNQGQNYMLYQCVVCTDTYNRTDYAAMAGKAEALLDSFECRETYLQPAR